MQIPRHVYAKAAPLQRLRRGLASMSTPGRVGRLTTWRESLARNGEAALSPARIPPEITQHAVAGMRRHVMTSLPAFLRIVTGAVPFLLCGNAVRSSPYVVMFRLAESVRPAQLRRAGSCSRLAHTPSTLAQRLQWTSHPTKMRKIPRHHRHGLSRHGKTTLLRQILSMLVANASR